MPSLHIPTPLRLHLHSDSREWVRVLVVSALTARVRGLRAVREKAKDSSIRVNQVSLVKVPAVHGVVVPAVVDSVVSTPSRTCC